VPFLQRFARNFVFCAGEASNFWSQPPCIPLKNMEFQTQIGFGTGSYKDLQIAARNGIQWA
jgi:hypothetical protein